jgi:hypothetical protein
MRDETVATDLPARFVSVYESPMSRAALLLLCLVCVLGPRMARAQDDLPTRLQDWFSNLGKPKPRPEEVAPAWNTFTLNPLALRDKQLGIEYERALGRGLSLYLAPGFAYGRAEGSWDLTLTGTLGTRFFVLGSAPSGLFFGPEVSMNYQRTYRDEVLRKAFGLGLGGSMGWTLVLFNRLVLSVGFSAQYRAVPDLESPEEEAIRVEIVPLPRLAFGVAF